MCEHHNDGLYGVVLAVLCRTTDRFLLLRELRDKPQVFKKKGMLAFPSETRESADACVCATVTRLMHEEIGATFSTPFKLHPQPLVHFRHGVPVYVAWVEVDEEFVASPYDIDVEHACWSSEADIQVLSAQIGSTRIETIDVLETACTAMARAPSHV